MPLQSAARRAAFWGQGGVLEGLGRDQGESGAPGWRATGCMSATLVPCPAWHLKRLYPYRHQAMQLQT